MMAEGAVPLFLHLQMHFFFNLTSGNKGEMFVGLMGKRTLGGGETIPFSFSLSTAPLGQYYSTGLDNTARLSHISFYFKLYIYLE